MNNIDSKNTTRLIALLSLALVGLALTGCGSGPATPETAAPAVVVDTAPPAVPVGLAAAAVNQDVKITWQPNTTDADFAGFMVYRVAFGQAWPMLDAPTAENFFLDDSPLRCACAYAVTALDQSGNESAWLEVPFQGTPQLPERDRL